jgi:predicted transcriptional regulator
MSLLQTFSKNFEFKRLIPLEKIKIAEISIILERSQKCVIGKIQVKMLGKNQNGTT